MYKDLIQRNNATPNTRVVVETLSIRRKIKQYTALFNTRLFDVRKLLQPLISIIIHV